MKEMRVLRLIENIADTYYKSTGDKWWLRLAIAVTIRINEGNRYIKWSRQGSRKMEVKDEGI